MSARAYTAEKRWITNKERRIARHQREVAKKALKKRRRLYGR